MNTIRNLFLALGLSLGFAGASLVSDPAPAAPAAEIPPQPVEPRLAAPAALPTTVPLSPIAPEPPVAPLSPTVSPAASPGSPPESTASPAKSRDQTAPSQPGAVQPARPVEVEVEAGRPKTPAPLPRPSTRGGDQELTGFGDVELPAGEVARVVVAILGNAEANGPVEDAVVAVLGNSFAREDVGNAVVAVLGNATAKKSVGNSVVAVLGDGRVEGQVHGQVVVVGGGIWLGPHAVIDGDVVCVGGKVIEEPGAVVKGRINQVPFLSRIPIFATLGLWFQQAILKGRLLAFPHHLLWPWVVALGFLGFYLVIAAAFEATVTRCVETLEQRPLKTMFAALLALVVAPALMVVLLITVIGTAAVFFAVLAALVVGKTAFLAWIGRRFSHCLGLSSSVLAVLLGGLTVLALYTVPVVGLLVWMLGSTLGLGMSVYTVILTMRRDRAGGRTTPRSGSLRPTAAVAGEPASAVPFDSAAPFSESASAAGAVGVVTPLAAGATADSSSGAFPPPLAVPVTSATLPRVGFWIRIAASLLDAVLVAIAANLLRLGDMFLLLMTAYSIVMWAKKGTTVGGIICGLKVVRLDDRPLDWSVAVVRALGAFLSLSVAGLGFIWVAFDDDKQSWHDKIAGTTIVRVPRGVSLV